MTYTYDDIFDRIAERYHVARPGYPSLLFEFVQSTCSIDKNTTVLEIGAGSGNASQHIAAMGCSLDCIEPGKQLYSLLSKELAGFPNVRLFNTTFESFLSDEKYDVIMSATAFHWLNPETKFNLVDKFLAPKGKLVLVWNHYCHNLTPECENIGRLYNRYLGNGEPYEDPNLFSLRKIREREVEALKSGLFFQSAFRSFVQHIDYTSEGYTELLKTYPFVTNADENAQKTFLTEVDKIISHIGIITVPVVTVAYIYRKINDFSAIINSEAGF